MKARLLIYAILCLAQNVYSRENDMQKIHTVMVMLEAKAGKEQDLKLVLQEVQAASKQEDSCLKYLVYQDHTNPALFALYEEWKSKELHALQFAKPYIIALGNKFPDLLEKPYTALLGCEI